MAQQEISKAFWAKLVAVPIVMFGFGFALVPLYSVLCDVTGLNGSTGDLEASVAATFKVDESRTVEVNFLSSVAPGFPIEFKPKQQKIEVMPGKMYSIQYLARNTSDQPIIGQAVPSVAPTIAALHFKKLECFCYSRQTFAPGKLMELPVRFVVEPELSTNVKNITLSYNFFKITK